jgi:hypothetical protein
MDGSRQQGKVYRREEPSDEEFTVGDDENEERPEDDEMIDAEGATHNPPLAEGTGQHCLQPVCRPVEAVFVRADGDQAQPFIAAETEKENGS